MAEAWPIVNGYDTRKQAIIDALRAFVNQRPGFELANYGDTASYRSDSRRATRQKDDALRLLRDIELRDSITADAILKEAESGRVTITVTVAADSQVAALRKSGLTCIADPDNTRHVCVSIDYCTGQYFCTEFRGAVARLCASVLWTWKREQCMPDNQAGSCDDACYLSNGKLVSAGDWLCASFKREYGAPLAGRYFS